MTSADEQFHRCSSRRFRPIYGSLSLWETMLQTALGRLLSRCSAGWATPKRSADANQAIGLEFVAGASGGVTSRHARLRGELLGTILYDSPASASLLNLRPARSCAALAKAKPASARVAACVAVMPLARKPEPHLPHPTVVARPDSQ